MIRVQRSWPRLVDRNSRDFKKGSDLPPSLEEIPRFTENRYLVQDQQAADTGKTGRLWGTSVFQDCSVLLRLNRLYFENNP